MNIYEKVLGIVGNDLAEVFGESGSGKTTFSLEVIKAAKAAGKKVFYIDTERNIREPLPESEYIYIPSFRNLYEYVMRSLPKVDVLVIDSIGTPALGEYATLDLKQKGDVLLRIHAMMNRLKKWTYENSALSIVTTQPVSDFNKAEGAVLAPFGDKQIYYVKEVWKTIMVGSTPDKTVCMIESFRSRQHGRGKMLWKVEVRNQGVLIE